MKAMPTTSPRRATGLRPLLAAVAAVALAGCSGGDLKDYLIGDGASKPATAAAPAPAPALQPGGAALPPSTTFAAEDAAISAAGQGSSGIQKVSLGKAQGVAVTVNDEPITNHDITQRIQLENALGGRAGESAEARKQILDSLVDEAVAKSESRRKGVELTDRQIDDQIKLMAERTKTTPDALRKRLSDKGVEYSALRRQVEGNLYIRYVMSLQGDVKVEADPAEVDRRYNEIVSDPRLKPVTVTVIQQIDLPVENTSDAMRQQLLYARAVEAQQIMQRYSGCKSLRAAAQGIFNVRIGKPIEAVAEKLPAEMRAALNKAGTTSLVGPAAAPDGIRLFANCGSRKIEPPRPSREQIENLVLNETYTRTVKTALTDARSKAYIDYKDPSFRL